MHLSQVVIQNFRGIARARLDLDGTTVLLGENDSGKSRLIDALAIGMGLGAEPGGFHFQAHDFTRRVGGRRPKAIRIELQFREAWSGEWLAEKFDPLRPVMTEAVRERRQIKLAVRARKFTEFIEVDWSFRDKRGKAIPGTADPELLVWLRRLNPLLLLRDGFLSLGRHGAEAGGVPGEEPGMDPTAERLALRQSVETHYRQIVGGGPSVSEREIEAGFEAARELVGRTAEILKPRDSQNLLATEPDRPGGEAERPDTGQWLHGSGAQRIGLLLAIGALLEARVADFWPGAEPIVVVEDPETHLHPLTLASVWDVIDSIKWQKVVTTHSGDLLAAVPLGAIRRLVRQGEVLQAYRLGRYSLKREELRKVSYHVRAKRGTILFARCWLLAEGESEFWILPRLAEACGYDLAVEGVAVVEFAQCGLSALIKLANDLNIQWCLLADGDEAGQAYSATAGYFLDDGEGEGKGDGEAVGEGDGEAVGHITTLNEADIERCMWHHGYADLYRHFAGRPADDKGSPGAVIRQAIRRHSKPFLALAVAETAAERGPDGVPEALGNAIRAAVDLAAGRS